MKDRGQALQLLEKINGGEISFGDAARKYSSCPSSGSGGSLGQFGPGQMSPAFDALVFDPATKIGEINVCGTQFGTHLVKVLVRTGDPPAEPAAGAASTASTTAPPAAESAAAADPLRAAAEAAAETANAAAAPPELMEVVCPAELGLDRRLRIALPDARQFDVVVPTGVAAGDVFRVGPFPAPDESSGG